MLNNLAGLLGTGVAASTTSFESIATVTVGSGGSSSISFSSIPSTYKHLQIRAMLKNNYNGAGSDYGSIKLNNDSTSTNYNSHYIDGYGSGIAAGVFGNSNKGAFVTLECRANNTSTFGVSIIDILDYTNTNKYKTIRSLAGSDENGTGNMGLSSGLYMSTSAITQIDFVLAIGTAWKEYSSIALYGVKG